jgi:hypothetical protein
VVQQQGDELVSKMLRGTRLFERRKNLQGGRQVEMQTSIGTARVPCCLLWYDAPFQDPGHIWVGLQLLISCCCRPRPRCQHH